MGKLRFEEMKKAAPLTGLVEDGGNINVGNLSSEFIFFNQTIMLLSLP